MCTDRDTNKKIVIAIDGFSSCGKSTFAKAIARRRARPKKRRPAEKIPAGRP